MNEKQPVTAALFDEWSVLDGLLAGLDDSQWLAPSPLPSWTVQDVTSHIIGTESFLLGEKPPHVDIDIKALPHVHNPIGELNERWVQELRPKSPAEMLELFREVTGKRREILTAMTEEEWNTLGPSPIGEAPYGRFMRVRVFDCWMHELDIRDAVGIAGDEGGPRGELAFNDILEAIGYIVGKRGKAPEGSRISIELTGDLARTINVTVDGRAKLVETLDAPPTAMLRLDSGLFVRLCGGRTTVAEHNDEIELSGDLEVAQRIADNLKFVF